MSNSLKISTDPLEKNLKKISLRHFSQNNPTFAPITMAEIYGPKDIKNERLSHRLRRQSPPNC